MIGSSNRGFARYALEEIRNLLPNVESRYLEPDEVFFFSSDSTRDETLGTLLEREPVFLRHVQPVEREIGLNRAWSDIAGMLDLAKNEDSLQKGEKVAIQVRKTGGVSFEYTPYAVKEAIDTVFAERFGVEPAVRGADRIVSIYLAPNRLYWGVSSPRENLSDWSGGMARFRREEGRVSRAEFKLLEAEGRFGLGLATFSRALDIGAAPGGWTSLLLKRGLRVTAVDPSPLHPSLSDHPGLTRLGKKAQDVTFDDGAFDLLVCDINWNPRQTAKLVRDLLPALGGGGEIVLTVKLMSGKPSQTIAGTLSELGEDVSLLHAKQLFHNRKEVTLHLRKR